MAEAKNNIDVLIRTLYERTGIKASVKDLDRLAYGINKSGKVVDAFTKKFADTTKVMQSMGKQVGKFQMGWLSVMFAAMLVWKIMKNLWKDMLTTFKKVGGKMHPLNLAMTRLTAGFTYLKYSIIEAMGPMLEKFILWLANLAISIADMDPQTLKNIGIGLAAIAGVAGLALIGSQLALLVNGVKGLTGGGIMAALGPTGWLIAGLTALAAIGIIEIFKDPDQMETVKQTFVDMKPAINDLTTAFGDLFEELTNLTPTMGNVGWTFVWIIDIFGDVESALANTLAAFINFGEGIGSAVKLAWYSLTFQNKKAKEESDKLDEISSKMVGNVLQGGEAADSMFKTLFGGPKAFKENALAQQDFNTAVSEGALWMDGIITPMTLFKESIDNNTSVLPGMTAEIWAAKDAIDAIPDHTTKVVEIKTIHTGDSPGSRGNVQTQTPYGG